MRKTKTHTHTHTRTHARTHARRTHSRQSDEQSDRQGHTDTHTNRPKNKCTQYSLFRSNKIDHTVVFVRSKYLTLSASQPYILRSPAARSDTRTLSPDFLGSDSSMKQEEYSLYVMHSLETRNKYANTFCSGIVYILSDGISTSGSKCSPQHSTSCRLEKPLKLRTVMPTVCLL